MVKRTDHAHFKDNWVLCSMAERAIQVAVEILIDIADSIGMSSIMVETQILGGTP